MKTTLDLPEELVREMKIRAATQGRKLREIATEVIQKGLSKPEPIPETKKNRVKLPFFEGTAPVDPKDHLTPERVHEILLDQEIEWHHEASGH